MQVPDKTIENDAVIEQDMFGQSSRGVSALVFLYNECAVSPAVFFYLPF